MHPGPTAGERCRVRALRADDEDTARALVYAAAGVSAYAARLLELLAQALAGLDEEARALVCERDGRVVGLAMYGVVAGTRGAARLFLLTADADRGDDVATGLLLEAVGADAAASGARFLMAEVPHDEAVPALGVPLRRHGFVEEGRVADYFRDGIDLLFLRLELAGIT